MPISNQAKWDKEYARYRAWSEEAQLSGETLKWLNERYLILENKGFASEEVLKTVMDEIDKKFMHNPSMEGAVHEYEDIMAGEEIWRAIKGE